MNSSIAASSEKNLRMRAWNAIVDANPVLAKELLVTARTPLFRGSVVVAPLALGAIVLLVRSAMRHQFDSIAGRQMFSVYFTGLSIALGMFGAALGSTVVVHEREAGTLETLKFSALSPRRIVLGKFAAVVLAEGALVIATLPFFAFVLAMPGVSLGESLLTMSAALAFGIMTASTGVAVSASASNTRRSLLVSLLGAGVIAIGFAIWFSVAAELGGLLRGPGPLAFTPGCDDTPCMARYLAFSFVLPAYALANVLWLSYAAAMSGLMDSSDDRGRPIRRWMLGAYATGMIALFLCSRAVVAQGSRDSIAVASMIAAGILACALLFVFVGEPLRPTRRMQAHPRSAIDRILCPCLVPSLVSAIAAGGIALLSIPMLAGASVRSAPQALWAVAFLSVLGASMGSIAAYRGPTLARRVGASAVALLTFFFVLARSGSRGPAWADVLCPLWLDPEYGARAEHVLSCSLVAWGMGALASFAILFRVVRARADRSACPV